MGDPRRQRKQYTKPKRPFETERFEQELELIGSYGLRNKRELWKHRTELSNYRRAARGLLALPPSDRAALEKEIIDKLTRRGILKKEPSLDSVLDLTLKDVLERRLQTVVFKKGLACSPYHARQLVVHGHIALNGARVTTPSRIMTVVEEEGIDYAGNSPERDPSHPARVAASMAAQKVAAPPEEKEEEGSPEGFRRGPHERVSRVRREYVEDTRAKVPEEAVDEEEGQGGSENE
jgi:small subunit ribosomal protein S4